MPITAACGSCKQRFQLKEEMAGKRFKCPKCGGAVQAPAAGGPAASPAPARKPAPKAPAPVAKYSSFLDEELGEVQERERQEELEKLAREYSEDASGVPEDKEKYCESCKKPLLKITSTCPYCGHTEGDLSKV